MNELNQRSGLQEIIDAVLEEMAMECGEGFTPDAVNLAEFSRRTGLTRSKARTIKSKGFKVTPHGRTGMRAEVTVLTGYTAVLDNLLRKGVTNSEVCTQRIAELGYPGGVTTVKNYIACHRDLVPARRKLVTAPQGSRGRRYKTGPGESYQMDWGFVNAEDSGGSVTRLACFAMVCHHCGECYVEFFTNARQENLLIGMLHAFMEMGVPESVLTDNMKSVVTCRDADGHPIWQKDYEEFMKCVGFKTRLCKPRHPFTKGSVERLVRFVKENFLVGRKFTDLTDLNSQASAWCAYQGGRYRRAVDCVPRDEHLHSCMRKARELEVTREVELYLCPRRKVSFDGFVCYEGRRFGVPYWYDGMECRVGREGPNLHIYSADLSRELTAHAVTWGRRDSFCEGQYSDAQPCESPTAPVRAAVAHVAPGDSPMFAKFDFGRRL